MGYKKTDFHLTFADIALFNSLDRNRAIKRMEKISTVINWSKIEPLVVRGMVTHGHGNRLDTKR